MLIQTVTGQKKWNSFLLSVQERASFSQSWEWGEILQAEGRTVERLALMEGDELLALAQVVYNQLPFGLKCAFCPQGPAEKISNFQFPLSNQCQMTNDKIYKTVFEYFKQKKYLFFRFEPSSFGLSISAKKYQLKVRRVGDINPRATVVLDLQSAEEEILAKMHPKTRYNIRLAEKKNLIVSDKKDVDVFLKLMKATAERDGFRLHPNRHYEKVLSSPTVFQISSFFNNSTIEPLNNLTPLAAAVFVGFGNTFTYLYGASANENRNLMAPYLIQWEGIKLGKKLGYKYYDFFGVAPKITPAPNSENAVDNKEIVYDRRHQYAGVTRFKFGFGGEYRENPGTFDLIISPEKYRVYEILRILRRFL